MNTIDMSLWQDQYAVADSEAERLEMVQEHLERLDIPPEGKAYVIEVAATPPSRKVGAHRNRNLLCEVPIPRMGVTLQAESGSGEYFFLLEMSRRRDVLAIYDQPIAAPLRITTKAGVRRPIMYTPDFLIVFDDRVEIHEVRRDEKLDSDCQLRPVDWTCVAGVFHYLRAEEYFQNLGISHVTSANSKVSAIRADNLRLLIAVGRTADTLELQKRRALVQTILDDVDVVQMADVLSQLKTTDVTAILQLIDKGFVFADLDSCLLSSPSRVWISKDPELPKIALQTNIRLETLIRENQFVSTTNVANPRYIAEVARRFAACGLCESSDSDIARKSQRTQRRYRQSLREANGDPRSLIPKWEQCGNRTKRLSGEHSSLVRTVISDAKRDPNSPSIRGAFRTYAHEFGKSVNLQHQAPIVYQTFAKYFADESLDADSAFCQGGRRLQNASADSIDPSHQTLIPTRAFAIAHTDHYNVDLALVVGKHKDQQVTKRAWLTALVDAFSGEVLGLWLSFRSPCRQSCAMVLRDCVRRHGRLPEIVVVDNGPDFQSVHFTTMLATLGVTRIDRPAEDPRFGKEVERLFGAFKERFCRGVPGYIPGIQHARKTSGTHSASKRASLTLADLIDALEAYTFNGYNHEQKPGRLETRLALRAGSDEVFPFSGISVVFDTAFMVQTAVEAPVDAYQLSRGHGVRVYDVWYSSRGILDYRGPKKGVSIRVEPFNKSVVYVCLNRLWHVCRSSDAITYASLPESEVFAATTDHQQLRNLAKQMALESERHAYEQKRMALPAVVDQTEPSVASKQTKTPIGRTNAKKQRRLTVSMEDIADLPMDEEAA